MTTNAKPNAMPAGPETVAGELLDELVDAAAFIRIQPVRGGWSKVSADLPEAVAAPFLRALRRVETDLVIEDALQSAGGRPIERSAERRSADAFVVLMQRISSAVQTTSPG
jgi:hypothetical protein